jgi:hypothetical protein
MKGSKFDFTAMNVHPMNVFHDKQSGEISQENFLGNELEDSTRIALGTYNELRTTTKGEENLIEP